MFFLQDQLSSELEVLAKKHGMLVNLKDGICFVLSLSEMSS